MKKVVRTVLAVVMICAFCVITSSCKAKTCDLCGKNYHGASYYYGVTKNDMEKDVCRDCAANYWAPLNVENFIK